MDSLSRHYKERSEHDPDPKARAKMIEDLKNGQKEIVNQNAHLNKDLQEMHHKVMLMKDTVNTLNELYTSEKNSQKDAAHLSLANLILEDERDVAKVKHEAPEFLALSPFRSSDSPLPVDLLTPRTFSLKQFRELVYTFMHTSTFREEHL